MNSEQIIEAAQKIISAIYLNNHVGEFAHEPINDKDGIEREALFQLITRGLVYYDPTTGSYRISNFGFDNDEMLIGNTDMRLKATRRVMEEQSPVFVTYNQHISPWGPSSMVYSGGVTGKMEVCTLAKGFVLPLPGKAELCLRASGVVLCYDEVRKVFLMITGTLGGGYIIHEMTGNITRG